MLINGIELSSLGVSLHDRILSSNRVKTTEKWVDGSLEPTFIRQQDSFKAITLQFLITEQNEEDAFLTMSNLTMLLKRAIIIFDDMPDLQFDVSLVGETKQERLKNGNFVLTVKLKSDYAKGSTEIHTTNTAATDSFNLTVVYYKDNSQLISNENVKIKSSDFVGKENISQEELGIRLNKYQQPYYGAGIVTNFNNEITYENLYSLGILIINYAPTVYYKEVEYYLWNGISYDLIDSTTVSFTYNQIQSISSIGQLINLNNNRPNGYKATCMFNEELTFENIVNFATAIPVYYDIVENDRVKDVTIRYTKETDNGNVVIDEQVVPIRESDVVDGTVISSLIELNKYKPQKYYEDGICQEIDDNILITFDTLLNEYNIYYSLTEEEFYVEYYNGVYPGWNRTYTDTFKIKQKEEYAGSENIIESLNINLDKYKSDYYLNGEIFNSGIYESYDDVIGLKVIQIFYRPKEYTLTVKYVADNDTEITEINSRDYVLTDMMFATEPELGNIISINLYRPEGYSYDKNSSYNGEVSLSALIAASPITITYKPVAVVRTKSIVIKYIKQLKSTFSTTNTAVLTIEEASVAGGVKLKDLFDINLYRPQYYNEGVIDGYSADSYITFDQIDGTYDVYYYASTYSTQVRYYTDEISVENQIGSNNVSYTVLSFDSETTLGTLGLNVNEFKPPYCGDGEVQPLGGALNFETLRNLAAINIIYYSNAEPDDGSGIDYPHRILFLQHNDYGSEEGGRPKTQTLNHAYINTGVIADDISKTTVQVSTLYVPGHKIYTTTPTYSYLFGAKSPQGSMYIGYHNRKFPYDSTHGLNNYFIAKAGAGASFSQYVDEDPEHNPQPHGNCFSRNTGIYATERLGVSFLTLTHTDTITTDSSSTEVPIYLFACNNRGNYQGGISGVGISGCKIYKDGVLVRDFIPVQYYDLIGTQVAPSNCLYDKVTQSFFEDATGLNSFNIIDDEEYPDYNPLHKIGKIYINYYKDNGFFQNRVVYFRGNEIDNGTFNLQEVLAIDKYQPRFYGTGSYTTTALNNTFEGLNNAVFEVNYPRTGYYISMNYYKDSISVGNLLGADRVYLTEDMFYQVPTFGQLFDLLKYKPEGYKLEQANIPYTQSKITLERILQSQPYDVIYTPCADPQVYSFKVKYYKHRNVIDIKNPINQYELIAEPIIEVDETQIIDGVYPEDFIDFNAYKPQGEEAYQENGVPFEWYTKDENLLTPDELREEYIIVYEPITQHIDIKYYTDEIDPDDFNLVASDTQSFKINDWGFGEEFQIVDELPNSYINKYKPVNCNAGELQEPEKWYTFDSLVKQGHLDILYMTKAEPHDPEDDSYPEKVLFQYADETIQTKADQRGYIPFTGTHIWQVHNGPGYPDENDNPQLKIPYMNLGYTPKEIGRLSIQVKAYALADSCQTGGFGQDFAPVTDSYAYFLGYMGAPSEANIQRSITYDNGKDALFGYYGAVHNYNVQTPYSSASTGWLAFRGHIPTARGFSKQFDEVCNIDGNNGWEWSNDAQIFVRTQDSYKENVKSMMGGFRLGKYATKDENFNQFIENHDHFYEYKRKNTSNHIPRYFTSDSSYWNSISHEAVSFSNGLDYAQMGFNSQNSILDEPRQIARTPYGIQADQGDVYETYGIHEDYEQTEFYPATIFNPTTMTIDAYHNFIEIYDMNNDQNPTYYNIDTSNDYDLFVDRCKPKGPIRLFATTNPDTGEVNVVRHSIPVKPQTKNYKTTITSITHGKDEEDEEGESGSQNQPGTTFESHGGLLEMSYNPYTTQGINCPQVDFRFNAVPSLMRAAVWGLKIQDRGKLVRDMIPVAQGDQIYDYVAPFNGLFDKVTEIFFGVENEGGTYASYNVNQSADGVAYDFVNYADPSQVISVVSSDVYPLRVVQDPTSYGKMIVNYYDYDNSFLGNKWVRVPTDYEWTNINFKDLLAFNDYKPSEFYHDGMLDTDTWLETDIPLRTRLHEMQEAGSVNVYYKQKQYAKTVVYYNENTRIGSKDFFFSQAEIEAAHSLADLGIDPELYRTAEFKPGVVMSDETIIESDDVAAFIDAPSPIVVYHKYTKEERPDLFYIEYYRGGAYEPEGEETIVLNSENKNYLDCDLSARVLNPRGLTKYLNHYHSALYEDEEMPHFIAYQVDVAANYVPIHKGPARAYTLLAHITDRGRYTIVEERNGWGRLKEYPKGWILLKYTNPVVGPGQNPDFDNPLNVSVSVLGQSVDPIKAVTIPFGTRLSITKMTIDRLWAYTPEYGSWIKTEEISFDQQGRLYSALGIKVFHLDQLDQNNINSFADIVGDIQYLKPRFHNNSNFVYDGELSQAGLSNLHSVDIIYFETIYPYVVKYYQNIIDENNVIGRGAFSCSLSDWNPDWDTFLSTSYLTGKTAITTENTFFHRVIGKTADYNIPANEDIFVLSTGTYQGAAAYYILWNGYIGQTNTTSTVEITDYTERTISPVLYRETPLALTQDFYNLNKNLYKPDYSYADGIMTWNPHTWDNEDPWFTFEELITTGGQKVLYVPAVDIEYKASFEKGWYDVPVNITNWACIPTDENPGLWDIEVKFKTKAPTDLGSRLRSMYIASGKVQGSTVTSNSSGTPIYYINCDGLVIKGGTDPAKAKINMFIGDNYKTTHYIDARLSGYSYPFHEYLQKNYYDGATAGTYYNIINFSNKRPYKQAVALAYGQQNKQQSDFEFSPRERNSLIKENTYPTSRNGDTYADQNEILNFDTLHIGAGSIRSVWSSSEQKYIPQASAVSAASYYQIKTWYNYELTHYWIPLPKGYWLPNGQQAPEVCFYDLITQSIAYNFYNEDYEYPYDSQRPIISKNNADVYEGVDYFNDWEYEIENVNITIQTTEDVDVYRHPDVLSSKVTTVEANTQIPVKQLTQDSENHVQGIWYNIKSGWIQASSCTIINNLNDVVYDTMVALKADNSEESQRYYGYIRPEEEKPLVFPCEYFTFIDLTGSLSTGLYVRDIGKVEMTVSGKLAPISSGLAQYSNKESFGYIFGNDSMKLRVDLLEASTTQTNVQYDVMLQYEGGQDFGAYVNGVKKDTINQDSSKESMMYTKPEYCVRIGAPYNKSEPYIGGQGYINYHVVKIYDRNNILIRHYVPELVQNEEKQWYAVRVKDLVSGNYQVYNYRNHKNSGAGWYDEIYTRTGRPEEFNGDTEAATSYISPVSEKAYFTTENVVRVYYNVDDFYWNGRIWIPASYTDDYKIMYDNPKTYIVGVANIYSHNYPIQVNYYRKNNYLAGDRVQVIGHLGKNSKQLLLDNNEGWMYNNEVLTELET